ncbi:DivIVA domain-containing protein [Nocardia jiangsuensis]|uniref:DivIVA domain-containing protein n=1 Tax=Nocardia jiangsuensis TaxID=1691563 RepID=A0ABV8DLJ4_9NOCA
MLTLLLYVLIVGLVAAVLFLLAGAVFGRAEELGPLPEGTTATVLPAADIAGADVRSLRFQQAVRGYKAVEVDWALARLAERIDELQHELALAHAGQDGSSRPTPGPAPAGWTDAGARPQPPVPAVSHPGTGEFPAQNAVFRTGEFTAPRSGDIPAAVADQQPRPRRISRPGDSANP